MKAAQPKELRIVFVWECLDPRLQLLRDKSFKDLREITALSFILEARCFIDQRDNSDPSEAPHEKLALIGNMSLLCQEPPWHPTRGKNRITNAARLAQTR